ncbi:hypothetical protein FNF29_01352 [Cafeteria roenbergensis]|uniref:BSD domain-containing protein n=1 Tax=Cafeteria roenbergensis TaxID=33653 RepID=A0A5A8CS51_CAFRO|nr:hypothetical protein FNF29_01352 [Cafeteria roenbergensis]|eukprot:KAA0155933.1 hypothetical protein FNF29_01352 [Cafeteria roenbergensis]
MESWSTFFSSVAQSAQQTVQSATERVKQKAKEHHEKFLAEREAHVRSEEEKIPVLSRLPWEGLGASDRAREAAGEVKAAVIALADDRATYTTAPPSGAGWAFDLRTRVEAVERLLKAVPAVDKHRFKLVPRVVSEELFFSNFFYKAELVRDSARVRLEAEEGEAVAAAAAAAAAAVPDADGRGHEGNESLRDASDSAPEHDSGGPGAADEDLFDLEQLSAGGNSPSAPADGDDEVDDDELEAAIAAELAQSDEL